MNKYPLQCPFFVTWVLVIVRLKLIPEKYCRACSGEKNHTGSAVEGSRVREERVENMYIICKKRNVGLVETENSARGVLRCCDFQLQGVHLGFVLLTVGGAAFSDHVEGVILSIPFCFETSFCFKLEQTIATLTIFGVDKHVYNIIDNPVSHY